MKFSSKRRLHRIREIIRGIQRNRRKRSREIDVEMVWSACKDMAPDIETARCAFMIHALNDEAWTADMSDAEIVAEVEALQ